MSAIQEVLKALLPKSWGDSMEAESREWKAVCGTCGLARSIWDLGGIRWKAAGQPVRRLPCPRCAANCSHTIRRQPETPA